MVESDVPVIAALIADPAVARWWGPHDADRVRADLLEDPGTETWVAEHEGDVIGVVLISEKNTPDYRHAGLDIAIRADHHGRGFGRESLRLAIEHLIARGHHRFTIDPVADNERAIRCYAGLGFRRVGLMRQYERGEDGTWRDGLLMELLADELRPAEPRG
jgi:aminoglycoside 6'-N-acetyltransferase